MLHPNPNRFTSVQEYLAALNFSLNGDYFVCGDIKFPQIEISGGYTPTTFAARMEVRGWMPPLQEETKSIIRWPFK
jgi:hypothetical protein